MVDDARYRQRVFLATYLSAVAITMDDDATAASYITCFSDPPYSLRRVFFDKDIMALFSVEPMRVSPRFGFNHKVYAYDEMVPITVCTMDKIGVTAVKLQNKCAQELRRIFEANPEGSLRGIDSVEHTPIDMGGWFLHDAKHTIRYRREANQASTTASISYGMGVIVDGDKLTGGVEGAWTDAGGNTGTFPLAGGDIFSLVVTVQGGAGDYYIKNGTNLGLSTDTYTKIRFRYYTSNASVKAKIVVGDDGAYTQEVLADTSSTTWTIGEVSLTAGKTLDHISLYADHANGSVYYDFVQIYRGDFTFPNIASVDPDYQGRSPRRGVPGKGGDLTQKLGSKSTDYRIGCDMSIGTWTTTGFANKPGELFMDILHNGGVNEPWQWIDLEDDQFKFCLDSARLPAGKGEEIASLIGHEYRLGSANSETTVQRWSLDQ